MSRWFRRLVAALATRRIRARGIDLASLRIPAATQVPLLRDGLDPKPDLARWREEQRLHRLDLPFSFDAYLVTGHQTTKEILGARDAYSNDIRHLFRGDGPATADDIGGLGFTDPPLHTRLRKIVTPEFTMHRLARLQPMIEQIVTEALDDLQARGPGADLAETVAFPVPFRTICALLGLDYSDERAFASLGSARFDATNGGAAAFGAVSAQRQFLFEAVARQREAPGPGLIGQIIREHGDSLSDTDLGGLADGIFTGGFETTAGMIALSTVTLLRDSKHAHLVREGAPGDVDGAVEELLRYLSVVQLAFPRFAKHDMRILGQDIKAGDVLMASLSAANRDRGSAGEDAERFDPFRVPTSSHLAFGYGVHRCIGAELARMELRTVLPALLRRFPTLELAVPEHELTFRQLSFVYGLDALPVRW